MAKAQKQKAASAAQRSGDEAAVIRRQLAWIGIVLAAGLGLSGLWWWGQDTGWGNADRAVATKLKKGEEAFVNGRADLAAKHYETVVERYPEHPQAVQALTQWATALQQQAKLSEALGALDTLLAKVGAVPEKADLRAYTLLQIGKLKKDLGDFDGALQAFAQVREKHPKTDWAGEAQSGVGSVYQAQHKYKEAREAYMKLVLELPGGFLAAEAQTAIGECLEAEGDKLGAAKAYQKVLDKYPSAVWDTAKARLENLKKDPAVKKTASKEKG